jgi:hypothetical protein
MIKLKYSSSFIQTAIVSILIAPLITDISAILASCSFNTDSHLEELDDAYLDYHDIDREPLLEPHLDLDLDQLDFKAEFGSNPALLGSNKAVSYHSFSIPAEN